MFADDIIIFTNGEIKGVRNILALLERYQNASGQVFNKAKTRIFHGCMPLSRKIAITTEIGINVAQLPEKYLGVQLITCRVTRASVANVVDKISRRLDSYKNRQISFKARAVLIRAVLESSFVHSMEVYKWLAAVLREANN